MAQHFTVGGYPNADPHYISPEKEAEAWDRQEELRREYAEDAHEARHAHRCWCSEDIPGWCPGPGSCPMVALRGEAG